MIGPLSFSERKLVILKHAKISCELPVCWPEFGEKPHMGCDGHLSVYFWPCSVSVTGGSVLLCMHFTGMILGEASVQSEVLLPDHLCPVMKQNLCSVEPSVFQDDPAPMSRAGGLTEWFDENENNVNHVLWSSKFFRFQLC